MGKNHLPDTEIPKPFFYEIITPLFTTDRSHLVSPSHVLNCYEWTDNSVHECLIYLLLKAEGIPRLGQSSNSHTFMLIRITLRACKNRLLGPILRVTYSAVLG